MKFFVNRLIFFVLVLLIGVFFINIAINSKNKSPQYYQLHYDEFLKESNFHNGIILGSSHATHGIRPSYLTLPELTFFNFALNGAGPEFYYKWYNDIFDKMYNKPEFIIFCVEWFLFDPSWLYRRYEHDSEYFPRKIFVNNFLNFQDYDTKTLFLNRYPFLKHNRYKDLKFLFIKDTINSNIFISDEFDNGFIPYEDNNHTIENPNKDIFDNHQLKYFNELLNEWTKDSIAIVFIHMPEYAPLSNYYVHKTDSIFRALSEQYKIPFLNYNIEKRSYINNNIDYYSDWGHLNGKGSIAFSKLLNNDLYNIIK